jgi:hypothetical protein
VARANRLPRGVLAVVDASAWLVAVLIATGLRYLDTRPDTLEQPRCSSGYR